MNESRRGKSWSEKNVRDPRQDEDDDVGDKEVVFNFKRARHEVFKFGISGLEKKDKHSAKVEHAISLGARPRKGTYKNYKKLMEEKKEQQAIEQRAIDRNVRFGSKKQTSLKKPMTKKGNSSRGLDGQIGKYKDGVQFIDKKDIRKMTKRK